MRTKNTCFLVLLFCLGFSLSNFGQLIVDAGKDTTFCTDIGKMYLGNNVTIKNGVEPYSISWECKVPRGGLQPFYTASDLLSDTTAVSPIITGIPTANEWITFTLYVTDSENNSAKDSIKVRFSKFAYLTGYPGSELNKGDSILLKYSSIGGGIEPLKFHYQPETGLANPDSLVTWSKPEVSTTYNIIATDSCGCVSEPNTAYYVIVRPTRIHEIKNGMGDLLNIRQNGKQIYFNNPLKKRAHITLYSINGVAKSNLTIMDDHFETDNLLENNGIYIVKISLGDLTESGKYLNY